MTDYSPGEYRAPAHAFITAPYGRALWAVRCDTHEAAHALCASLLAMSVPPAFDVETWEGDEHVLVLVEEPQAQSILVWRKLTGALVVRANLDITGTLTPGRKALEAL